MRTFAFGCSLTQYFYPTWADILIHHYKQEGATVGENWGRSGAGNQYISTRLWEAHTEHKFNKDDIILLQWSSFFREASNSTKAFLSFCLRFSKPNFRATFPECTSKGIDK